MYRRTTEKNRRRNFSLINYKKGVVFFYTRNMKCTEHLCFNFAEIILSGLEMGSKVRLINSNGVTALCEKLLGEVCFTE